MAYLQDGQYKTMLHKLHNITNIANMKFARISLYIKKSIIKFMLFFFIVNMKFMFTEIFIIFK